MIQPLRTHQPPRGTDLQLVSGGPITVASGSGLYRAQAARATGGLFGLRSANVAGSDFDYHTQMLMTYQHRIEVLEREVAKLQSLITGDRPPAGDSVAGDLSARRMR